MGLIIYSGNSGILYNERTKYNEHRGWVGARDDDDGDDDMMTTTWMTGKRQGGGKEDDRDDEGGENRHRQTK